MLVLAGCFAFAGSASADDSPRITLRDILRAMADDPTVPAEWSGVWSYTDSIYSCLGGVLTFEEVETGLDTLCTGMGIGLEEDLPGDFSCSGGVTSTTVDITCNGTFPFPPDCTATTLIESDGTRTGESYVATVQMSTTVTGSAACSAFPEICQRIVTHANRVAGEPSAYCATQIEPTTWGSLKSTYR